MVIDSSTVSRFFIGLLPPPDVQAEATALKQFFWDTYQSRAALKSPPHITLQPPFQWPLQQIDRLQTTLVEFARQQPAVPVQLSGFGAFPPRVIYINVGREGTLMALQPALAEHLATALAIIDSRSQNRPFAPHLTVAFRDLKPAAFRKAWPEFEHRPFTTHFVVPALTLFRHDGQRWQIFSNFPFKP